MKKIVIVLCLAALYGCATAPLQQAAKNCIGNTELPAALSHMFEPVEDQSLLQKALGEPHKGGLCAGKVYRSKGNVALTLHRAWNSTNPGSRQGKWWAFSVPQGAVNAYRADYEICYQWSPLDMLASCKLVPDTLIVVGPGQSAECSQYLSYPVSAAQQIYIDDANAALANCRDKVGVFSWQ